MADHMCRTKPTINVSNYKYCVSIQMSMNQTVVFGHVDLLRNGSKDHDHVSSLWRVVPCKATAHVQEGDAIYRALLACCTL